MFMQNLNSSGLAVLLFSCIFNLHLYELAPVATAPKSDTVKGFVCHVADNLPLPGAHIQISGTNLGTIADQNGRFQLAISGQKAILVVSFIGMISQQVEVYPGQEITICLEPDELISNEIVITALGISRERRSIGYATQRISGHEISRIPQINTINALAGRVSGVQIRQSGNFAGSTDIVVRGFSSLTQNNQAIFVIDGIPFSNTITNHPSQAGGFFGYDYGNAAMDINTHDIESIQILKGAAATALYGSRAANGVVLVTTKTARSNRGEQTFGVSYRSIMTAGRYDPDTFPKYQNKYGAGYGPYYGEAPLAGFQRIWDVNGDGLPDLTIPTGEDASMGQRFDPQLLVFQWDAFDPASPNYGRATPWMAARNGPSYVFESPLSAQNSLSIQGFSDTGTSYRISFSRTDETGLLPNSQFNRSTVSVNLKHAISQNLQTRVVGTYVLNRATGRNITGYSENIMTSFRQWMQTNVDYGMQKRLYELTGRNTTWNMRSPVDLTPVYWNNPYFQRFQNANDDERSRFAGLLSLGWDVNDFLNILMRLAIDTSTENQQERRAVGSAAERFGVSRSRVSSGYARFDFGYKETNAEILVRYNRNLTQTISLSSISGLSLRRTKKDLLFASTDGGLIVPGIYALSNSVNSIITPEERLERVAVNGLFMSISLGYLNTVYLDVSLRRDQSSTLPSNRNYYYYPSVSASWVFAENSGKVILNVGRLRVGWASVGNDAPWGSIRDTYVQLPAFGSVPMFSLPSIKNNTRLKPETTRSFEAGLDLVFFENRAGLDVAIYQSNTYNQIMPLAISEATGFSAKFVNGGEIRNRGLEIMMYASPVQTAHFRWDSYINWSANQNQVIKLAGGIENLQLAMLQGGVSINARVGEPYGSIHGTDYIYTDGQRTVGSNGYYLRTSTSDIKIGNINPRWIAGWGNNFNINGWSAGFLIDIQQGGDIYSLDMHYGLGTGIYPETVFLNDLGNPVRSPVSEGGGLILPGVNTNGQPNTIRVEGGDYRVFGWATNPNKAFVYDASYIKLREVTLGRKIPAKYLGRIGPNTQIELSLFASNLWIIHKNLPYSDPEAGQGAGNIKGWQTGTLPTTQVFGLSIQMDF
jgi:TonB-linked SusC/RagA family outer membrane protein